MRSEDAGQNPADRSEVRIPAAAGAANRPPSIASSFDSNFERFVREIFLDADK